MKNGQGGADVRRPSPLSCHRPSELGTAMNDAALIPESKEKILNRTIVRRQQGDLTALPVDDFVCYTKDTLEVGADFGTAIQVRGGDAIKKELQSEFRMVAL
jgi:hypothetical protein